MTTKRTSISIRESLYKEAIKLADKKHFSNFSQYVEDLLRKEVLNDPTIGEDPVEYAAKKEGDKLKRKK